MRGPLTQTFFDRVYLPWERFTDTKIDEQIGRADALYETVGKLNRLATHILNNKDKEQVDFSQIDLPLFQWAKEQGLIEEFDLSQRKMEILLDRLSAEKSIVGKRAEVALSKIAPLQRVAESVTRIAAKIAEDEKEFVKAILRRMAQG